MSETHIGGDAPDEVIEGEPAPHEPGPMEPVWQGFFGPIAVATAAKLDAIDLDPRAEVHVPPREAPPMLVDPKTGVFGMFAVQVRFGNQIPRPAGLYEAGPDMVGRMLNA